MLRSTLRQIQRRSYATVSSSNRVKLVEVGPRDGLQNEKAIVPLATKLELIDRLADAGLTTVEAGAFVSPKWVPQMANSKEILSHLQKHGREGVSYTFLVPNMKGLEAAQGSKMSEVAIFAAASETFSQKNINCSIAESLERFQPVIDAAKEQGIRVRAYISVVLGCPYEGDVSPQKVAELAVSLLSMGADEISFGDTTGVGTPPKMLALLKAIDAAGISHEHAAMHLHDTYGMALTNSTIALERGIRIFDSSIGGLGGCPYAKGATGNVATEDLIYLFHSLGLDTGVDLDAAADTGDWISKELGRANGSRVGKAMINKREA